MNEALARPMPIRSSTRRRRGWVIPWLFFALVILVMGLAAAGAQRKVSRGQASLAARREGPESLEKRGLQLLEAGDPLAAERLWRRALECDPGRASTWAFLGRLALQRQELGKAVELMERALAIDEASYPALEGLAAAHRLLGHATQARAYQACAERIRRSLPPSRTGMGVD